MLVVSHRVTHLADADAGDGVTSSLRLFQTEQSNAAAQTAAWETVTDYFKSAPPER